jgi:hypothetical protein
MKLLSLDAPWTPLRVGSTTELHSDGQFTMSREACHIEPSSSSTHYVWVMRTRSAAPSHPPMAIGHRCFEQRPDRSWRFCESVPAAAQAGLARQLLVLLASAEVVSVRLADTYTRVLAGAGFPYSAVRVSVILEYAVGRPRARRAGGRLRVCALSTRGGPFIESRWDSPNSSAPMIWYPGTDTKRRSSYVPAELEKRWRAAGPEVMRSQGRAIRALLRPAAHYDS